MFILVLSSIVNVSNHTKFILSNNQKFGTQTTIINLNPSEYSQEFHYYSLEVVMLFMTYLIKYVFQTKQRIYT